MKHKSAVLYLSLLGIACCLPQDASDKSLLKPSDAARLAKKHFAAKPAALLKSSLEDSTASINFSDLGITVPAEDVNDTIKMDHHTYYNSTFYSDPEDAKRFWINMDELPNEQVVRHEKLSDSHRQAATIELSFGFPFYGHPVKSVTIATGGFLYMGDYLHNFIAATQYVAPLMANFDTSLSDESNIKYADNGTALTVLWENVRIQDRKDDGTFTFQVTLLKSGDIIFAYKDIPFAVSSISSSAHPVKIGLSDAYILERTVFFIRRKTVYEYNRINMDWKVSNNTALYFSALPTCNTYTNCSSCLEKGAKMDCSWCEAVNRCSDGVDRLRQSWVENGCVERKVTTCPATEAPLTDVVEVTLKPETSIISKNDLLPPSTSVKPESVEYTVDQSVQSNDVSNNNHAAQFIHEETQSTSQSGMSPGAIATILVFLAAMIASVIWIIYAYKYPQTSSGQFLIKYRPSQWVVKKDGAAPTTNSRHF